MNSTLLSDKNMDSYSFIMERINHGTGLPGFIFDASDELIYKVDIPNCDLLGPDPGLTASLRASYARIQSPVVALEKTGIYHLAFPSDRDMLFVLGPASIDKLSFHDAISFNRANGIEDADFRLPVVPLTRTLNAASILYERVTGRQLTDGDIFRANDRVIKTEESDIMRYEFSRELEEKHRHSYAIEQKWISDIENGIFDSGKIDFSPENMDRMSSIGLLSESSFKQIEYMVITTLTLASRAAMRAGVSTYEAYTLSDLYFQKISKASNVMELLHIYVQIASDYSDRVRRSKDNRNAGYTEKAVNYITRHRTHRFTVSDIAEDIGVSKGHLSRTFTEEMGVTLQEYIMKQRLLAGADLLKHTDLTIGEISEYLSFSSQSYFSDRFRKEFDVTPQQYRKIHKVIDF